MPTPSIQTLVNNAQAVLALQNMTTIRSTLAVALANANTGTPLNPGLTNQQLIDEARQVMTLPKSDIESIIVNQLMKFLNSPPAPGGVGADKQVIWNDAGVLTGDPNFTWDGPLSLLNITGAATITGNLTAAAVIPSGSTVPTNGLYLPTANNLGFACNSTLGMILNSTGLGIGTTILGGQKLAIGSSSDTSATANGFNIITNRATIQTTCNGAVDAAGTTINYSWANGGQGPLIFRNASISNVMTLNPSGNVGIGVTPAGTGGCLHLKSGITFPATQVASSDVNTLDDYEEGTWTGTLKGSVSDPTTPVTATGRYTKIGRVVSINIDFGAFNSTGASGNVTITGLPFANGLLSCGSVESGAALTFSGTLVADVSTGGTTIQLQSITSNNFAIFATHNAGNPRYLTVTLTYTV